MAAADSHVETLIADWASGKPLSDADASTLLEHAQGCARCGALYEKAVNAARMLEHGTLQEPSTAERELLEARGRKTLGFLTAPTKLARRRISPAFIIGPLLAVAAAALIIVVSVSDHAPLVEAKGLPVVETYLKHGEAVTPYQEGDALAAGDQLRFRVAPAGARFITVVGFESGAWKRLEEQAVFTNEVVFLDRSLELDAAGARESFSVVFSDARLSEDELAKVSQGGLSKDITVVPVVKR